MASVFLSYDRDDTEKARPIAHALEKAGHSVWWDLQIRGGAQFSKVIEEALNAAEAVVVLWSGYSIDSPWVRDEAAAGRDSGRLVPITIDGTQAPLGFRQFQTLDLSRWKRRGASPEFARLLADIESTAAAKRDEIEPTGAGRSEPLSRSRSKFRPKLAGGTLLLILLVAAGLYWSFAGRRTGTSTVTVESADSSSLSQSLAHNVLVNLGSAAGSLTSNVRLLEQSSRARPDLRLAVSGIEQSGGTRATVALTSSRQDGILWSKQIQEPANQRSSLDQAAAYAAMNAISCAADDSSGESRRLSASDFHAYVTACASLEEADDTQPLIAIFRRVIDAAPGYTAAWANLLNAEADALYDMRLSGEPAEKIERAIRRDVVSARKLSPDLPEASIAEVSLQPPTAFLQRIALIDKAAAAHPDSANLLVTRAQELSQVGRMDEALGQFQQAAQLKPYSPSIRSVLISATASSGGIAKASADLAEAKKLWPDSSAIVSTDTYINLHYGDFEKTWRAVGNPIDGGISGYFKILRDPSDANIDAWINLAKTHEMLHPHRIFILQALGPLKRVDQLYQFLGQWPIDKDLEGITYILFRPWLANVRRDPRFMRLAKRVGLLDYWEKSGKWPDFCAEPDMPYDCKKEAAKLSV